VVTGDITRQDVDAIVNAANSDLVRGGGVDHAIHEAAGPGLQRELDARYSGCPTGDARLTSAYQLSAKAVIHCVGPIWHGGGREEDRLLASCYRQALALARQHDLRRIAFPAISTGVYGFPRDRAAAIAVATVRQELAASPFATEIRFVCFDDETAETYRKALGQG